MGEYDVSFTGPWRAPLMALAHARAAEHQSSALLVRWALPVFVITVLLWRIASLQIAILGLCLVGLGALTRAMRGTSAVHKVTRATIFAQSVEREVLQAVAKTVNPAFRVRDDFPLTADDLNATRMLRVRADALIGARCITGQLPGRRPFCAAHVGVASRIRTRRVQPRQPDEFEVVARGTYLVTDGQPREGWIVLTTHDQTWRNTLQAPTDADVGHVGEASFEAVFAIRASTPQAANAALTPDVRARMLALHRLFAGTPFALAMDDGTLSVFVLEDASALQLGRNPDQWTTEVQHFTAALTRINDALTVLHAASTVVPERAA